MMPESTDVWDWDPMLVGSVILNTNRIDHLVIGASAIYYHGLQRANGRGSISAGNPPWKFTNNFEVGIHDEYMPDALVALTTNGLFELTNGDNCDTMYEGTGPLVKLQAAWSTPTVVNLILLPTSSYFPLPPETQLARRTYYITSPQDARLDKLPFPKWQSLLLSLAYRAVAHQDQMARRSLATLQPEIGLDPWTISMPDDWAADVRRDVSEMLHRWYHRDQGHQDYSRPSPWRALRHWPMLGSPLFGADDNTAADAGRVDYPDLGGQMLITPQTTGATPHVVEDDYVEGECAAGPTESDTP